jgi:hypothetical protein
MDQIQKIGSDVIFLVIFSYRESAQLMFSLSIC